MVSQPTRTGVVGTHATGKNDKGPGRPWRGAGTSWSAVRYAVRCLSVRSASSRSL